MTGVSPSLVQALHGPGALSWCVRLALLPLSLLYATAVTLRNALYDAGLLRAAAVDVPVVSVGNLTTGGTGKTPLVVALARRAASAGRSVGIVTRGYGAVADETGRTDEVALLSARCPGARVFAGPDKLSSARQAAAAGVDLVLLDDGFQSRRLGRDLDIVVLDARRPFSNGWVLPGGGLREAPSGLGRADLVVLTHHEDLTGEGRQAVQRQVRAWNRSVPILRARHDPAWVRSLAGGSERPPEVLMGREVFLFCGVASPEGFRRTVERLGADVAGLMAFPDHHAFTPKDLARVRARARAAQLVCTEKDADKVARIPGHDDVWCLGIDLVLADPWPRLPGLDA